MSATLEALLVVAGAVICIALLELYHHPEKFHKRND
jgi:hypothetical protein